MYRLITWRNGYKEYLQDDAQTFTTVKALAWVVDQRTAELYRAELWAEPLSEAEMMERAGVKRLEGF